MIGGLTQTSRNKSPLEAINTAERETTLHILEETNRAFQQSVDKIVTETEKYTNPQTLRYIVPLLEASIRQTSQHLLTHQNNATLHVQQIANAYRSRVHIDI